MTSKHFCPLSLMGGISPSSSKSARSHNKKAWEAITISALIVVVSLQSLIEELRISSNQALIEPGN